MKRDYYDYLKDISESIKDIEEFTKGMDFEDFLADKKSIKAVIRCLEVIGEAAKKIPSTLRKKYPEIPWKQMTGMRDKLIHEYHGVDPEIVWVVVKEELPPLEPVLIEIIKNLEKK